MHIDQKAEWPSALPRRHAGLSGLSELLLAPTRSRFHTGSEYLRASVQAVLARQVAFRATFPASSTSQLL